MMSVLVMGKSNEQYACGGRISSLWSSQMTKCLQSWQYTGWWYDWCGLVDIVRNDLSIVRYPGADSMKAMTAPVDGILSVIPRANDSDCTIDPINRPHNKHLTVKMMNRMLDLYWFS